MNKSDYPVGTVATIGHPSNNILIVKGEAGWRYVESGEFISYDDYRKATWNTVTIPGERAYLLTDDQAMDIMLCPGHDYKGHQLGVMLQPTDKEQA